LKLYRRAFRFEVSGMRRPFSTQRWPLVVKTSGGEGAPKSWRIAALVGGVALIAGAPASFAFGVLGAGGLAARFLLFVVGVAGIVWSARSRRAHPRPSGAWIESHADGLRRITPDGEKPIVAWSAPFGVALLASYGRPYALLAFTTPTQTRYIPTRIDDRTEEDDELFSRIAVLADLDLVDGVAHDAALPSAQAASLVRAVEKKDAASLGRVYLSDGRGTPIALDRATLSVGEKTFDLTSEIEWRALMFHESTGQAAALYQATWVRQSGKEASGIREVVLVAPMPASIVPREPNAHKEASGRLGRALTRELKLLQAPAESPPARDIRVAIDRPFMMAVRRALDDAPLAQRVSIGPPARASRPERRA
jgi:hypothetical protein